jgi:AcrR family transcriptional regulator
MCRTSIANIDEKILDGVIEESFQYGIGWVSTKDIAQNLGISEPVIFSHFHTKKNLILSAYPQAWKVIDHCLDLISDTPWDVIKSAQVYDALKQGIDELFSHPKELSFVAQYEALRPVYGNDVLYGSQNYLRSKLKVILSLAFHADANDMQDSIDLFVETLISDYFFLGQAPRFAVKEAKRFILNFAAYGSKRAFEIEKQVFEGGK